MMKLVLILGLISAAVAAPIESRGPIPKHLVSRILQLAEKDRYDTLYKDAIKKGKGDEFKAQYKKDQAAEKKEYYDGMRQAKAAGRLDDFYAKAREMQTTEAQGYWDIYMKDLHASKDKTKEILDKRTDWKSEFHRAHKEARKYGRISDFWKIVRGGGIKQEDEETDTDIGQEIVKSLLEFISNTLEQSITKSKERARQREAEKQKQIEDMNNKFEELPKEDQDKLLAKKAEIEKQNAERQRTQEENVNAILDAFLELIPEEHRKGLDGVADQLDTIMKDLARLIFEEEEEEKEIKIISGSV